MALVPTCTILRGTFDPSIYIHNLFCNQYVNATLRHVFMPVTEIFQKFSGFRQFSYHMCPIWDRSGDGWQERACGEASANERSRGFPLLHRYNIIADFDGPLCFLLDPLQPP